MRKTKKKDFNVVWGFLCVYSLGFKNIVCISNKTTFIIRNIHKATIICIFYSDKISDSLEFLNTDNVAAINGHGVDQLISSIHLSHRLKQMYGWSCKQ